MLPLPNSTISPAKIGALFDDEFMSSVDDFAVGNAIEQIKVKIDKDYFSIFLFAAVR